MMNQGLPGTLPPGERLLWQGTPDRRAIGRHVFHLRAVAAYFAVIIAWCAAAAVLDGTAASALLRSTLRLTGVALVPLVLMAAYAWGIARTTIYTVTSRRVVISFGIAFPMSINLPFARIDAARVSVRKDGSGDIALQLRPGDKFSYLVLWPNARPWRFGRPEPTLRGLADASPVARILARALAAANGDAAPVPVALQVELSHSPDKSALAAA